MKKILVFLAFATATMVGHATIQPRTEILSQKMISSAAVNAVCEVLAGTWEMTVAQLKSDYDHGVLLIDQQDPYTYLCNHTDGGVITVVLEETF